MPSLHGPPTLRATLCHDWGRKAFTHPPSHPAWRDHWGQPYLYAGTRLEYVLASREGPLGALLAARRPGPAPRRARKFLFWHGPHRLVEEAFGGWFGARFQRLDAPALKLLLDRLDHFLIADPSSRPTVVLSLAAFAGLGISHGVLESVLGLPVVVATEGLHAETAYVPSLRVYVDYDGSRYATSTRKLFFDAAGRAVPVELVAREALQRLAYDVVAPAVFRRFFHALMGFPVSHFEPESWPRHFLAGRLSPLEWVARAHQRLADAEALGLVVALPSALAAWARRPAPPGFEVPSGAVPGLGRYLNGARFASLLETVGDVRLLAILRGLLVGHPVTADWFAWRATDRRAHFCEVKSRGDTLRPLQKSSILYCQRVGILDYRLLELLHGTHPTQPFSTNAA